MSDIHQSLISKILDGDTQAFEKLVLQYSPMVQSMIYRIVHQADDAEDLLQDVFTKIFMNLSTLRNPSQLASWVSRIATNTSIQYLHRKRVRKEIQDKSKIHVLTDTAQLPDDIFVDKVRRLTLHKAINDLSTPYRSVILLYYFEGCTQNFK